MDDDVQLFCNPFWRSLRYRNACIFEEVLAWCTRRHCRQDRRICRNPRVDSLFFLSVFFGVSFFIKVKKSVLIEGGLFGSVKKKFRGL